MNKIILASTSPRRKELLEKAGIDFIIDASSIDEIMAEGLSIENKMMKLAADKATPIHLKYPDDIVIGADTIVYYDEQIIGKAKDESEARNILLKLSGHQHSVYTGVAIYFGAELYTFVEKTDVYFKNITRMLDAYMASGEWQGKAGAYGIQGIAESFVDFIEGDRDNVIGLPVSRLIHVLQERNVI